jgi:hypothetical protein
LPIKLSWIGAVPPRIQRDESSAERAVVSLSFLARNPIFECSCGDFYPASDQRLLEFSPENSSCIKSPCDSWCCPTPPRAELPALRFAEIDNNLTLRSMPRNTGGGVGLLRWCSIECKAEARYGVCHLECRAVVLNALRAEKSVRPMGAVDIGTIRDQ